ncbi:Carboxy-terminal domain (CTD) phosphatase [Ascosphaera aggregata]|nr:Carboxy-terminal domain (CTD) phosphatase [Ascosphaera aggregata]
MLFTLPRSLHYPITITKFMVSEGDEVELGTKLFTYTYTTTVSQIDGMGGMIDVQMEYPTMFESPVEGRFVNWKIKEKTYVEKPIQIAEIELLCSHDVQFGGLCTLCGKDMTRASYYIEPVASEPSIRVVHEDNVLTVSQAEAKRNEEDAKRRLLGSRKLSLVVDLDQTIIHATVDPTVAEWQNDPSNPNYEAVKDVRAFQLAEDGFPPPTAAAAKRDAKCSKDGRTDAANAAAAGGCWYYIKLRPGLEEFLAEISKMYEFHIYTMGTRAYARAVANIIDPTRKYFGDRILSRDESGSLTVKNLQRLFPVDTKMVVIIDDRGDVWKWTENLIKVAPYDFFVGIGDINSSFLPKKPVLQQIEEREEPTKEGSVPVRSEERPTKVEKEQDGGDVSTVEQLVTMGGGDNPTLLQEQAEKREETIQHQVEDRPLLQKQKALDEDVAAPESQTPSKEDSSEGHKTESGETSTTSDESKDRHHLLKDNDRELYHLLERLKKVHSEFFDVFDRRSACSTGRNSEVDVSLVPDVKDIMPRIKGKILEGVNMVYSGVLPLGVDVQSADLSLWAKSFGATVQIRINPRTTTHLITGKPRTAKVKEASKWPKRIKIVKLGWLLGSLTQWKRLDEADYEIMIDPQDRRNARRARKEGKDVERVERERAEAIEQGLDTTDFDDDEDDEDDDDDDLDTLDTDFDGSSMDSEDDDEERESVLEDAIRQSSGLNENSIIGISLEEQSAVHDELREFLGSDADDDSEESDAELAEFLSKKRKREEEEEDERAALNALPGVRASDFAHKAKRPTGLRSVENMTDESDNPKSPGLTPPPDTTVPTTNTAAEPPRSLDPLRGSYLEGVDYNPHHPSDSPDEAAKGPTYTAADAYDNDNYGRGGRYQLGGVQQAAEALAADGDDDALEREMLAAFEEGDWGAPEEEAHAEGVGQGNEGGPEVALKEGDVGDLTEEQKEAQEQGQFGLWGGEGNGPLGVGDPRNEEGDEAYSK